MVAHANMGDGRASRSWVRVMDGSTIIFVWGWIMIWMCQSEVAARHWASWCFGSLWVADLLVVKRKGREGHICLFKFDMGCMK